MIRRIVAVVGIVVAAIVVAATPAAAHAGAEGSEASNYLTELLEVDPVLSGIRVRVLELGNRLELTNERDEEIIVLGYEDEPYLRIGPDGVFENELSAATYINADRQATGDIPEEVDPDARPRWRKVSDGRTARWHDHRAHWMGSEAPPAVDADRSRSHVVIDRWEVPLRLGEREVVVAGRLLWRPGPSTLVWLGGAAAGALVVVALFLRFRANRSRLLAIAAVTIAIVDIVHVIGLVTAPGQVGAPPARFLAASIYPAMGWVSAVIGLRLLWRNRAEGVYLVAMTGILVLLVGGLSDIGAITRAHIPFAWSTEIVRALVAASLAGGAAVLAMCYLFRPKQALTTGEPR